MVWSRSDIDLVLVTIDDKKVGADSLSLYADGVNVHAMLMPRARFRQAVEGSIRNSFMHSFLAKGRLLYTHDETIATMFESLKEMGERDRGIALFRAATNVLPAALQGAQVHAHARRPELHDALDPPHGEPLATIEVISAGLLADREVIPQAIKLNPTLFATVYVDLLNEKKTAKSVQFALDTIDRVPRDAARRRCSRRCSSTCATSARRGRARRSRRTSRRRTTSIRDDGLRVPRRSGDHRQGVHCRAPNEAQSRGRAGAGVLCARVNGSVRDVPRA